MPAGLSELVRRLKRLKEYVTRDIWLTDAARSDQPEGRLTVFRFAYLVGYGFIRDNSFMRAAALTYTTVLSVAPFLAVAFSIAKSFGVQNMELIREFLYRLTAGRQDLVDQILSYVDKTNVKTLGTVGVAALFITTASLIGSVEAALNSIWNVPRGRTLWRKFTDFFSVTIIVPVFVLLAVSLTVSLQTQTFAQAVMTVWGLGTFLRFLLRLIPFFIMWGAFTFLYAYVPNTRVKFLGALGGAFVGALLWQTAQWAYVTYQVGAANYNAIYGSFAQFPLFLVWVYLSWVIVLFGGEVSFATQNIATFAGEIRAHAIGHDERTKIAILILLIQTRTFLAGGTPPENGHLAVKLGVPVKVVNDVNDLLARRGFMTAMAREDGAAQYTLARPPEDIHLIDIARVLGQATDLTTADFIRQRYEFVHKAFDDLWNAAASSPANRDLRSFHDELCDSGRSEDCL